jgi:hypothetical protein
MIEMAKYEGKCPNCGKIHRSESEGEIVVCDCWRYCPICGTEMTSYTLDLAPRTYGVDSKKELQILMICTHHSPPFYSSQKPVEVELDEAAP